MSLPRSPRRVAGGKPYKRLTASTGLERGQGLKRSRSRRPGRDVEARAAYDTAGLEVVARSGGRCEADGIHHPDCPGVGTVRHHIVEQRNGGGDGPDNLLWVWGGDTVGGIGGCHGRITNERGLAEQLGYVVVPFWERPEKVVPRPWGGV